jgi:predicted Zn-dependent protease
MIMGTPASGISVLRDGDSKNEVRWNAGIQTPSHISQDVIDEFKEIMSPDSILNKFNEILPALPAPPSNLMPQGPISWPEDAQQLSNSLMRQPMLDAVKGGIHIDLRSSSFNPRSGDVANESHSTMLYSPRAWVSRVSVDRNRVQIDWAVDSTRAVLYEAMQLGRRRKAQKEDLKLQLARYGSYNDYSLIPNMSQPFQDWTPVLKTDKNGDVLLTLRNPQNPAYELRFWVDPRRHVLLRQETWIGGKISSQTTFDGFIEVAGCWWATRVTTKDAESRTTRITTASIKEAGADSFERQFQKALPDRNRALLIQEPVPDLAAAKKASFEKHASFEDFLALIENYSRSQQWKQANELWQNAETMVKDKPGVEWLTDAILEMSRRNEELSKRYLERARRIVNDKPQDELFLCTVLQIRASRIMQANERLALHESLRPVFMRQIARLQSDVEWRKTHAQLLLSAGRREEARNAWESLSKECPKDTNVQIQYMNAMAEAGELPAALQRIMLLLDQSGWTKNEKNSVRNAAAGRMNQNSPTAEWLAFLEEWLANEPDEQQPYEYYLQALIRMHQVDKANALISQWGEEGIKEESGGLKQEERKQSTAIKSIRVPRLQAAVRIALGDWNYSGGGRQYNERLFPLLANVVKGIYGSPALHGLALQIMQHYQFRQSKEAADLRRVFVDVLLKDMDKLDSLHIQSIVMWLMDSNPALKDEIWQKIASAVTLRWETERDISRRHNVGSAIIQILRRLGNKDEILTFLRRQTKEGPAEYLQSYTRQLFDELLIQSWKADIEDECFGLLGRLSSAMDENERFSVVVPALYRLVDSMKNGRYRAAFDAVPKKEEMSRTEYISLQRDKQKEACNGLIKRLADEARKQDAALAPWLVIERIALAAKQKQDARTLAGECFELLGATPAQDNERTELQRRLADRGLTTLIFLAAQQARDEKLAGQTLQFIDNGIERNPDSAYWKYQKYRFLIALDRPGELQKALEGWIQPATADKSWQVALGYLMAERNRMQDAISLFEAVKAADQLKPRELRALADWYLVQGQKARYEEARIEAFMAEEEYQLSNRLYRIPRPWNDHKDAAPRELDPEIYAIFNALFRKSPQPQSYVYLLSEYYRNTHDFRLLECLPDGMFGHTEQQVYPFITSLQGLLNEVRDEATVDGIMKHMGKARDRATTRIDKRALDFLEIQAERRASELINQSGPHAAAALAAMMRAFKGDWAPGERRLMADCLAGLGKIKGDELSREQLRQLAELYKYGEQPAEDRLQIALRLAQTQWDYDRRDDALVTLEAALAMYREVNKGVFPTTANTAIAQFIQYLIDARHFARAEQYLQAEMKRPANAQQTYWMQERLIEVYTNAIRYRGRVSFGDGEALYAGAMKLLLAQIETDDPNHRRQLIGLLCSFFRAAKESRIELAGFREFAFETFPKFLDRETSPDNYNYAINNLAATLHDILGARVGLEFLIERIEKEPEWVRAGNRSIWQQNNYQFGRWRVEVKDPGNLSDRLLRIATNELRRDLRMRTKSGGSLYYQHRDFWNEKANDFLAVADQVWDEQHPSGAAARYIGEYLRDGLGETRRAISILDEAWRAGQLDEQGLSQLAQYQHEILSFEESIPVLGALVDMRPDTINYRTRLMHAYYETQRAGNLRDLLAETDKRFHERGLWQESNIAALAFSCLDNRLNKESAAYYNEVIPLHQRTQPNRGIGNGTLSRYYAQLSQAHAALNQTVEAVEAAGGAVVSWGSRDDNRRNALDALRRVLSQAKDLNSYVEYLEKQVRETGLENPTIRQALGQVLIERKEYNKAARHLQLAAETQPNDRRTYELLIQAYDLAKDPEGAIRQLLKSAELSRRDINLYRSLGDRFKSRVQQEDAERAYTSIVEMQPNESESHSMLAEIRQSQNRWPEAIDQWQQVVRIRTLEPTGFLRLAEAQIHEERREDALRTIDTLLRQDWPPRFDNVHQQAQNLKSRIAAGGR